MEIKGEIDSDHHQGNDMDERQDRGEKRKQKGKESK